MLEVTQLSQPEFGLKSGGQQSCYIGPLLAGISLPDCEVRGLFLFLAALGLSGNTWDIFAATWRTFRCGVGHLVPRAGIKLRHPALGAWSLTLWTSGEVPKRVSRSLILWAMRKGGHLVLSRCPSCVSSGLPPSPPHQASERGRRDVSPFQGQQCSCGGQAARLGLQTLLRSADSCTFPGTQSTPGFWRGMSGIPGLLSWHARSRRFANC